MSKPTAGSVLFRAFHLQQQRSFRRFGSSDSLASDDGASPTMHLAPTIPLERQGSLASNDSQDEPQMPTAPRRSGLRHVARSLTRSMTRRLRKTTLPPED